MTWSNLMSVEFLKLRTVRSPLALLLGAQLIVAAGVAGVALADEYPAGSSRATELALQHVGLLSLLGLVLGAVTTAGEYRHRTICDTYLAVPSRARVIAAKTLLMVPGGVVLGTLGALTALASTALWYAAQDVALPLDSATARTLAGGILWCACFTVIGAAVGAIVRNLAVAVAGALTWIALVEGIVAGLLGDGADWLPFACGQALVGLGPDGGPSPGAAGTVLAGWALLLCALAVSSTVGRDVP
ncbi:MAG: type transport system permease protein [Actinomycetota bacterium]|nr:type transport system permease protein [Actinomycetota bacterium]